MLLCIGPLQIGHCCSVAANSSLTHALHSAFLHFQIFVGFKLSLMSVLDVTYGLVLSFVSYTYTGMTHTGFEASISWPVGSKVPCDRSTRNVTILFVSRLAAIK